MSQFRLTVDACMAKHVLLGSKIKGVFTNRFSSHLTLKLTFGGGGVLTRDIIKSADPAYMYQYVQCMQLQLHLYLVP